MARRPISAPTAGTPVDHDVDEVISDDEAGIVGDGDLARLHGSGHGRRVRHFARVSGFLESDIDGLAGRRQVELGNGADLDAGHVGDAGNDVGSHLA